MKKLIFALIGLAALAIIALLCILIDGAAHEPLESILSDADADRIDGSANAGRRAL